jgi:hypothetical protein
MCILSCLIKRRNFEIKQNDEYRIQVLFLIFIGEEQKMELNVAMLFMSAK